MSKPKKRPPASRAKLKNGNSQGKRPTSAPTSGGTSNVLALEKAGVKKGTKGKRKRRVEDEATAKAERDIKLTQSQIRAKPKFGQTWAEMVEEDLREQDSTPAPIPAAVGSIDPEQMSMRPESMSWHISSKAPATNIVKPDTAPSLNTIPQSIVCKQPPTMPALRGGDALPVRHTPEPPAPPKTSEPAIVSPMRWPEVNAYLRTPHPRAMLPLDCRKAESEPLVPSARLLADTGDDFHQLARALKGPQRVCRSYRLARTLPSSSPEPTSPAGSISIPFVPLTRKRRRPIPPPVVEVSIDAASSKLGDQLADYAFQAPTQNESLQPVHKSAQNNKISKPWSEHEVVEQALIKMTVWIDQWLSGKLGYSDTAWESFQFCLLSQDVDKYGEFTVLGSMSDGN